MQFPHVPVLFALSCRVLAWHGLKYSLSKINRRRIRVFVLLYFIDNKFSMVIFYEEYSILIKYYIYSSWTSGEVWPKSKP